MGACYSAPFWFSAFCIALMPTSVGYQDLAAFLARQSSFSGSFVDRWLASPMNAIHAAKISFSRPIGTAIPEPVYQKVNFNPSSLDTGAVKPLAQAQAAIRYPAVDRSLKGDRLDQADRVMAPSAPESLPQPQAPAAALPQPALTSPTLSPSVAAPSSSPAAATLPPAPPAPAPLSDNLGVDDVSMPMMSADAGNDAPAAPAPAVPRVAAKADPVQMRAVPQQEQINTFTPAAQDDAAIDDKPPQLPAAGEMDVNGGAPSSVASLPFIDDAQANRGAQVFFSERAFGSLGGLEQWAPGAEPILVTAPADPEIKLSALGRDPLEPEAGGETIAGKGDPALLGSPIERLKLEGKTLAKATKCLADAVYFEARGEPYKGQEAIAQVVMNRVFSGFYPNDVCGVVYQNSGRHLACQFTFACEGKDLSRIDEPDMWEQAKQIAKDMLDGKIWLTEVGHATHYHAYWVHPSWVHEMTKLYKLGVHTFYRPRAWGDGDDAPVWGKVPNPDTSKADTPADKSDATAKADDAAGAGAPLDAATKAPETTATVPAPSAAKDGSTAKL
jgi:hypothetical protein